MLYNNPKSLLDAVSKIVSESKEKYTKEQQEFEKKRNYKFEGDCI